MSESASSKSPPSQRRIAEALRDGNLPTSHLVNASFSLFGCCCLATCGAGWAVTIVVNAFSANFANATSGAPFLESLRAAWFLALETSLRILAPICVLGWGALALAGVLQVRGRLRFSGKTKHSQERGRLVPSIVVAALVFVSLTTIWGSRFLLMGSGTRGSHLGSAALLSFFGILTQRLIVRLGATALCLVAVDLCWQWWRWRQRLRMSRAEVDEENRLLQGNPLVLKERLRLGRR